VIETAEKVIRRVVEYRKRISGTPQILETAKIFGYLVGRPFAPLRMGEHHHD
jgi:hypothetical protein